MTTAMEPPMKITLAHHIFLSIVRAGFLFLVFIMRPIYFLLYEKETQLTKPSSPLLMKSATELADLIRKQVVTSSDVVKAYIEQIRAVNPILNAMVCHRFDKALVEAAEVDKLLQSGNIPDDWSPEKAPFLGVPITIKEAFALEGMPQSSGLLCRRLFFAKEDAEVVANLKKAGVIPLCVTNTSELCMWYESSNLVYGRTNNAYHHGRIVGGSSGGEACIISAAGSVIGIGSDIGGSIRMPANFNGIFGHKPTTGVVSNKGQHPIATNDASTFLCTGPMCRYAVDLIPMLKIMAGSGCRKMRLDNEVDVKQLKYYYMENDGGSYLSCPVDCQVEKRVRKAAEHFKSIGATVTKVNIQQLKHSLEIWITKMNTSGNESFCFLMGNSVKPVNPFVELQYWLLGCPRHTLPAITLGIAEKIRSSSDVEAALIKACEQLKDVFGELLKDDGVFLYPSHPVPAPYHHQPIFMWFNFAYTAIFNVLGLPVTQVPMGIGKERVPIGIQVVAGRHNDHLTLAVAKHMETVFGGWISPF
ncbi:hypothetical protein LSH36_569g03078 [Paralvinella palmiformis]|uniref:Amidase domain-containing protein n=1 Tax=Paralvinella palmiformis TaxID=53620 RepID=A0AAD9MWW3_9ANNE|nr:hypothetical protein LSH36_569g03078 [Paralvinella palmiformis]